MNRRTRRRRARLRRAALIAPFVLIGSGYLAGTRLPSLYVAQRRIVLRQSPEKVWRVLTDLDGMPTWRRDLSTVERLPAPGGVVRWRELREGASIALEIAERVPPRRLVVRVADPSGTPQRRWVYQIRGTRTGREAEVTVREERTVTNPLRRLLLRAFRLGGAELAGLCRDLEERMVLGRGS